MPLTQNFTATQQIGLPLAVYVTDTSTGSDVAVTARRLYIQDIQGNYLVPSGTTTQYMVWALVDTSKSFTCLTGDVAPYAKVDWVNNAGTVLYTKTILCDFSLTNTQQSFKLTASLTSDPSLLGDTNWWYSKMKLRVNIDDALEAVTIGGNQRIAQSALDRATYMTSNQKDFF
jgi:hypothetical protein